jgi:hypothetical protein
LRETPKGCKAIKGPKEGPMSSDSSSDEQEDDEEVDKYLSKYTNKKTHALQRILGIDSQNLSKIEDITLTIPTALTQKMNVPK